MREQDYKGEDKKKFTVHSNAVRMRKINEFRIVPEIKSKEIAGSRVLTLLSAKMAFRGLSGDSAAGEGKLLGKDKLLFDHNTLDLNGWGVILRHGLKIVCTI